MAKALLAYFYWVATFCGDLFLWNYVGDIGFIGVIFPCWKRSKIFGKFPSKPPPKYLQNPSKNSSKNAQKTAEKLLKTAPDSRQIPLETPSNSPRIPRKLRSNLRQNTLHQLVYSRSFSSPISARFASCFLLICNIRSARKCQNWLKNGAFSPQNRVIRHPKSWIYTLKGVLTT